MMRSQIAAAAAAAAASSRPAKDLHQDDKRMAPAHFRHLADNGRQSRRLINSSQTGRAGHFKAAIIGQQHRRQVPAATTTTTMPQLMIVLLGSSVWLLMLIVGPYDQLQTTTGVAAAAAGRNPNSLASLRANTNSDTDEGDHKRAIFHSELRLRSIIELLNGDLRQLKRDFMRQMTDVYLQLKLDPLIGWPAATGLLMASATDPTEARPASSANLLLGQEFAEMLIRRHVVQRRLLTGLKLAFVKFLPTKTLAKLHSRYKQFAWLKDAAHVDLRPYFKNATENQFVVLYSLIELRARLRAAKDVVELTRGSILRILQMVQFYLIESKHGPNLNVDELNRLAYYSKIVLDFYSSNVFETYDKALDDFEHKLNSAPAESLIELSGGGEAALIEFLDETINREALDIDLNAVAHGGSGGRVVELGRAGDQLEPTISVEMIEQLAPSWIPDYVTNSVANDRQMLIKLRAHISQLVDLRLRRENEQTLRQWVGFALRYLCSNSAQAYASLGWQHAAALQAPPGVY